MSTMSIIGRIILVILGWYSTGLILVGLISRFDGPFDPGDWKDYRRFCYQFACLGPITALIILGYAIYVISKNTHAPRTLAQLTDWIIAGFRKPPA